MFPMTAKVNPSQLWTDGSTILHLSIIPCPSVFIQKIRVPLHASQNPKATPFLGSGFNDGLPAVSTLPIKRLIKFNDSINSPIFTFNLARTSPFCSVITLKFISL